MLPRKKLDLGWSDLGHGLAWSCFPPDRDAVLTGLARLPFANRQVLPLLSVRTGFDLVLRCLALPPGSEILVSAITIRDMVRIIEQHGLRAVPVDVDPVTCAISGDRLARAMTPRTRAVLVAHLFGSRMGLDEVAAFTKDHGLYLFEDCAQAFCADGYWGHPGSDVAMFSFGPIKTATALGGALLFFRDNALLRTVRELHDRYPVQSRMFFLRRAMKYAVLHALTWRAPYSVFAASCRLLGTSHDRIISSSVRGFAGRDLFLGIRQQPSAALLSLLVRRVEQSRPEDIRPRTDRAVLLSSLLPEDLLVGQHAANHTYWVFPIRSEHPDQLVAYLGDRGFDATRGASSLYALSGAPEAQGIIDRIVYLPAGSGASATDLEQLAHAVREFSANTAG